MDKKIVVIGAGAAGIGMGITLTELGVRDFVILDKDEVGNSFKNWPQETRFITPSFTSNGFGMSDLNAISVDTSPAFTLGKERLSGKDYAKYLDLAAKEYQLPVFTNRKVQKIVKKKNGYLLETIQEEIFTEYLIFAMGEYSFPNKSWIAGGKEHGIHYGEVDSWRQFSGDQQTIIGGNESGIDAALNLAELGKKVTLYTNTTGLTAKKADPSIRLSPFTRQKFFDFKTNQAVKGEIQIYQDISIKEISRKAKKYNLITTDGHTLQVENQPILCTGFTNGAQILAPDLFLYQADEAQLNDFDESIISPNVFLIGPSVRNQGVVFCYIYKFRQRFAMIAEEIAKRSNDLSINQQRLSYYKDESFYLDDCQNCEVNCEC